MKYFSFPLDTYGHPRISSSPSRGPDLKGGGHTSETEKPPCAARTIGAIKRDEYKKVVGRDVGTTNTFFSPNHTMWKLLKGAICRHLAITGLPCHLKEKGENILSEDTL